MKNRIEDIIAANKRLLTAKYLFIIWICALTVLSLWYTFNTVASAKEDESGTALKNARISEALISENLVMALNGVPGDIRKPEYAELKSKLVQLVQLEKEIRFAYFYTQRDGKIYFMVDSEKATSKDYSPPGQQYMDAHPADFMPFQNGRDLVEKPLSDRWGTWVSVLIPLKSIRTGKVYAVFGVDYDAAKWRWNVMTEVLDNVKDSFILFLFSIIIYILILRISKDNHVRFIQRVLDTIPNSVFYVSTGGICRFCNRTFADLVGISSDRIIGRDIRAIIPELLDGTQHPNGLFLAGDAAYNTYDFTILRKDGSELDVLLNKTSVFDFDRDEYAFIYSIVDVSEVRRQEREIEILFNMAIDFLAIVASDGFLKRVSPQWSKSTGWSEKELTTTPLIEFIPEEDRPAVSSAIRKVRREGSNQGIVIRFKCKDGGELWINWNVCRTDENDLYIITGHDITRQREIESRNREMEKTLHMDAIRTEFFANISHEFKTPLAIIISALQLMQRNLTGPNISKAVGEDLTAATDKHLRSIRKNSYRLLRLVNNLIDITRIDSGYFELHRCNCDIVSVIEEVTLSAAQYMEGKGIELVFDTEAEEMIICCDPEKIERIMLNLLSNAVKYTNPGGKVSVNIYDRGGTAAVSVKDTGIGIPNNEVDKIFERFRQVDKSLTRRCEGSGIGLSIVRSLVDMHGGTIRVDTELGKGSEFIFELPSGASEDLPFVHYVKDSENGRYYTDILNIEFSDIYL